MNRREALKAALALPLVGLVGAASEQEEPECDCWMMTCQDVRLTVIECPAEHFFSHCDMPESEMRWHKMNRWICVQDHKGKWIQVPNC